MFHHFKYGGFGKTNKTVNIHVPEIKSEYTFKTICERFNFIRAIFLATNVRFLSF